MHVFNMLHARVSVLTFEAWWAAGGGGGWLGVRLGS
jgi:hypothetical protein